MAKKDLWKFKEYIATITSLMRRDFKKLMVSLGWNKILNNSLSLVPNSLANFLPIFEKKII